MDGDRNRNFPSGSSGGGGKRGYGVKPFFLRASNDASSSDNDSQNHGNVQGNNNNDRPGLNTEDNDVDWMEEIEDINLNGDDGISSLSTSSDPEYEANNFQNGNGSDNDIQPYQGHGIARFFGYRGFIRFPHVHAGFGFASVVGAPILDQAGQAVRLNGTSGFDFGGRLEMNNAEERGNMDGDHAPHGQGPGGGLGPMYGARRVNGQNLNGSIFFYSTMTAFAHRTRNGVALSELLSLRDSHIFSIASSAEYANSLSQYCYNNLMLQEAMINHIECVKALMSRNLPLALSKQISCVNAVMRLLNDAYSRQEEWTHPVIYTVTFDLRIISERARSAGCRGRVIRRYDWAVNNVPCFYHPVGCRCRHPHIYRRRF